ncbi:hypothetical protein [Streptomyces naganishii]|uniref:hypothetical protein n=1 Tax=Streptomyces naganishii TaxID=285447 RepID=UPI001E45742F|nr:hypothetical protein [Streptomyces naganishii]
MFEAADHPTALLGLEPVLVHQDPLGPHTGVLAVGAELADGLACKITRFGDPAVDVDEDAGVPEHAVREDRHRDVRQAGIQEPQVEREPEFGDVEGVSADQAIEDLRQGGSGPHRDVDAVFPDGPVEQRPRRVVLEAPDRESGVGHEDPSLSAPLPPIVGRRGICSPRPSRYVRYRAGIVFAVDLRSLRYFVAVAEERHILVLLKKLRSVKKLDWSRAVIDSSHVRAARRGPEAGPARSTAHGRAASTTSSPTGRASSSRCR